MSNERAKIGFSALLQACCVSMRSVMSLPRKALHLDMVQSLLNVHLNMVRPLLNVLDMVRSLLNGGGRIAYSVVCLPARMLECACGLSLLWMYALCNLALYVLRRVGTRSTEEMKPSYDVHRSPRTVESTSPSSSKSMNGKLSEERLSSLPVPSESAYGRSPSLCSTAYDIAETPGMTLHSKCWKSNSYIALPAQAHSPHLLLKRLSSSVYRSQPQWNLEEERLAATLASRCCGFLHKGDELYYYSMIEFDGIWYWAWSPTQEEMMKCTTASQLNRRILAAHIRSVGVIPEAFNATFVLRYVDASSGVEKILSLKCAHEQSRQAWIDNMQSFVSHFRHGMQKAEHTPAHGSERSSDQNSELTRRWWKTGFPHD